MKNRKMKKPKETIPENDERFDWFLSGWLCGMRDAGRHIKQAKIKLPEAEAWYLEHIAELGTERCLSPATEEVYLNKYKIAMKNAEPDQEDEDAAIDKWKLAMREKGYAGPFPEELMRKKLRGEFVSIRTEIRE